MRRVFDPPSVAAAIVLGALWWPVVTEALPFGGYIVVPIVKALLAFDLSGEHLSAAWRLVSTLAWMAIFGIAFGLPLGLVVRGRVVAYWLVFVATVFLIFVTGVFLRSPGLFSHRTIIAMTWTLPQTWAWLAGVLCSAHFVSRSRR